MKDWDTDQYRSRVPAWLEFWLLLSVVVLGLLALFASVAQ